MPTSNGDADCPFCGDETKSGDSTTAERQDHPKSRKSKVFRTDSSHLKNRISAKSEHGKNSHLESNKPSLPGNPNGLRTSQPMHHSDALGTIASQSWINLAGFFVVIFLLGQGLMVWSFLAGHFGAWALGQTALVFGLTAALWLLIRQTATLADQNRVLNLRVSRLNRGLRDQVENQERQRIQADNQQAGRTRA